MGAMRERDAMGPSLWPVMLALEELTEVELRALIDETADMQAAPGLRAWIETSCNWEMNRRAGRACPMRLPNAPVPSHEEVLNVGASLLMKSLFAQDSRTHEVFVLFDAIVDLLTGQVHKS